LQVTYLVPNIAYRVEVYRTGYHANDAYSAYFEMGSPKDLTPAQIAHLSKLTRDLPESDKAMQSNSAGSVELTLPMNSNDIVLVKLQRTRETIETPRTSSSHENVHERCREQPKDGYSSSMAPRIC